MVWLLFVSSAAAGGFFHPNDLAAESRLFQSASEQLVEPVDQAQLQAKSWAKALNDYEEALDLWGTAGTEAHRQDLAAYRGAFNQQFSALQDFTDTFVTDFDRIFSEAMARQLARHPEAAQCERSLPAAPSMPGLPTRLKPNPECKGEDLNPKLAAGLDEDPVLQQALDELLHRSWPLVQLDASPAPVEGAAPRWLDVRLTTHRVASDILRQIAKDDRMARSALELELGESMSPEEQQDLGRRTRALNTTTASLRHAQFGPVQEAVDKLTERWARKGEPATGWCLRPAKLGGCEGEDATDALWLRLKDDRSVQRLAP